MSIANELITRGWCQKRVRDGQGRVCLLGAAGVAYGVVTDETRKWNGDEITRRLPVEVAQALSAAIGSIGFGYWNDRPERTFSQVLRVAKEADSLLSKEIV